MIKLFSSYRQEVADPGLTDHNPAALNQGNAAGGVGNSRNGSSTCLDLFSIPTRGVRQRCATDLGDVEVGFGNGYASLGHGTDIHGARLNLSAQANPESALGICGASWRHGDQNYQANVKKERRGSVHDMQSESDDYTLSDGMLRAQTKLGTDCRVLEARDFCGSVYSFSVPSGRVLTFTPFLSYIWVDKAAFRRLTPVRQASETLLRASQTGHRPGTILGRNVTEAIANVHNFELGDTMFQAKDEEYRLGGRLGFWNSFIDFLHFNTRRRQMQAELKHKSFDAAADANTNVGEVLFSAENGHGWKYSVMGCFGLQYAQHRTGNDRYREIKEYVSTTEGARQLNGAEEIFYNTAMPKMQVDEVAKKFEQDKNVSESDVRFTGAMRSRETAQQSSLAWNFHLLFVQPGFWTAFGRECKRSSRQEYDFRREKNHQEVIDRTVDTRFTNKVWLGQQPTVSEVTASEEWQPGADNQPAEFRKLRFFSKWQAKAPQTPEELNKVITHYNDLFQTDHPLLDLNPAAIRTTRHIKLDSELSEEDINRLGERLSQNDSVRAAAQASKLPAYIAENLRRDMQRATTLRERCRILRTFVAQDGVRAISFLHRINEVRIGRIELSADVGLFDSAIRYSGKIKTRCVPVLDEKMTLSQVEDRLWDITIALRLVHQARACVNEDAMLASHEKQERLAQLLEEEAVLRRLCEAPTDGQRAMLFQKLTERWHMTQQACEFAAVFQKVQDLGKLYEEPVTDKDSAFGYLRHYDSAIQTLRRVQTGTRNNILLTEQQRARHETQIEAAIARLEKDYADRCERDDPCAKHLKSPLQTCGRFWFTSWRGWRYFWMGLEQSNIENPIAFWPTNALFGLSR